MPGRRQRILIVDDSELNREALSRLFRGRYLILEAENGLRGLELLERYQTEICVMLLDMMMPELDGLGVLREMARRGLADRVPVVVITADDKAETALQGYTLGICDLINKPFNPEIVCRRIENIIDLYEHRYRLEEMVQEQTSVLNTQSQKLIHANTMLEKQAQKLRRTNSFIIDSLSTIVEFRNGESGSHIKRIQKITRILLEELSRAHIEYRLPSNVIDIIASASAMHDIGKIAIPDSVLLKPGKLTPEEYEIMKTHTVRGCELLKSLGYTQDEEFFYYCYEICRHHHERWDGGGYPDHLKGPEIPIWSQVVSIADVYDALVSVRVYKRAYPHEQAVGMIARGECGQFNPSLLACFLEVANNLRDDLAIDRDEPA